VPNVSVTKEIPQTGVSNNAWDAAAGSYTLEDSAYATSLSWSSTLTGASYDSVSFNVSAQESAPYSAIFNDDGTKMYVMGNSGYVKEYALSSAFDISTASYSSVNFQVSGQDAVPFDLVFNNTGTKMYMIGIAQNTVFEYDLSTAYDVSTASYNSVNFSVSSQETNSRSVTFNDLGTKMYVIGATNDTIYQYTLSTAFDVSSASYDSVSFSISSEITLPSKMLFVSSGFKMFILGRDADAVFQYSLSTAYDISTASYDSISFDISSQEIEANSIALNNNSSKMYLVGSNSDTVYQYSIPTLLSLGTGSFASTDVGKTINVNDGVLVLTATDGSYVETTAPTSTDTAASGEWSMFGVVYDAADDVLEVSNYVSYYTNINSTALQTWNNPSTEIYDFYFKPDGTKVFVINYGSSNLEEYSLSIPYDLSTVSSVIQTFSVGGDVPLGVTFKPDGSAFWICKYNTGVLQYYECSTNWSLSSVGSAVTVKDYAFNLSCIEWNNDGTKVWIAGFNTGLITEYTVSTAYDMTSTLTQVIAYYTGGSPYSIRWNSDGTKGLITFSTAIQQITASSPYTLVGLTIDNTFSTGGYSISASYINSGAQAFILTYNTGVLTKHSTSLAYVPTGYQPCISSNIDSTYWTDINSMTADQNAGDGNVYYAISTDDRTTWTVIDNTEGERDIVRNNAGTWQYNSNGTYASETWTNGTTNTELATLAEAMEGAADVTDAFDVSTASYDSVSFSVTSQATVPRGIAFNTDGTKMFVIGNISDAVHEYSLSTAFDISTASFVDSFSVSAQGANPYGLTFNNDGTKMFTVDGGTDDLHEYTLSTGFDISTASFSQTLATGANPSSVAFNNDGTKMFIVRSGATDIVDEYTLSTAFDISTSSFVDGFNINSQDTSPWQIAFNTDGTKMFIVGLTGDDVNEYTLSTGFDVSTASFVDSFSVTAQENSPYGLAFNNDGTKMYICGNETDSIHQYSVGTTSYTNQMDSTKLNAITDANQITLGNDLDFAAILYYNTGATVPTYSGTAINYDANILNQGAVLGTDYNFDAPASDKVRITAVGAGNYKVRVV
jgi:hypothetical protein